MASPNKITHKGVIKSIKADVAKIEMQASSACGVCKAAAFCGTSDSSSKNVEAKILPSQSFSIGEEVFVSITQTMGTKAIILGYGLPFVVIIIGIFPLVALGLSEGLAALIAILLLAAYYFVLYLCRNKIKKEFHFSIEKKLNN